MSQWRVVVTDHNFPNLEPEKGILEPLGATVEAFQCRTEEEVASVAAEAHGLLVQFAPITGRVIRAMRNCRIIVRYGVGYDNIDVAEAWERRIPVAYVPDYCVSEVADHTTALLLALLRRLVPFYESVKAGEWDPAGIGGPILPLNEVKVGLVGMGRIGAAVIQRLQPFGCQFMAYDPLAIPLQAEEYGVELVDLETLLQSSDAITLHAPLTEETRHLINAERLEALKPTAVLVNTARGALIDTNALAEALKKGSLSGAALDVFELEPIPKGSSLYSCPNLLLTPHAAWYSKRSLERLQRLAAEEVKRALQGESLRCPIVPGQ